MSFLHWQSPGAAALLLQAITWPRTRAACLSSLPPRVAFTDSEKAEKKVQKVYFKKRKSAAEHCTQGNSITPAHYVQKGKWMARRKDTLFGRF